MKIDWSKPGVPVSLAAHAALLVASLVALSSTPPFADAEESVAVEVITTDQLNAMTRGDKTAKEVQPAPKPRVDKVAEVEEQKPTHGEDKTDVPTPPARAPEISDQTSAPPLPPTRPPDPVKPPEPTPPPKQAATPPKPEPPKVAAEIPLPPERPQPPKEVKPDPPKPVVEKRKPTEFDKARIAQLLDEKKPEEPKPPKPPAHEKGEQSFTKTTNDIEKLLTSHEKPQSTGSVGATLQRTASLGTQTGNSPKLSPSMVGQLQGLLQDQFYKCFEPPPGVSPTEGARPMIHIEFASTDGALVGRPVLRNPSSDPGTRAFSEAAIRAVARCAPYRIPAQFAPYFEEWRSTTFQIDLRNFTG